MAITNSNSSVTSFYKCRAPFVEGPPAMGWEEYSGYPISALEQRYRIICAYLQVIEDIKEPIGVDNNFPFQKSKSRKLFFVNSRTIRIAIRGAGLKLLTCCWKRSFLSTSTG